MRDFQIDTLHPNEIAGDNNVSSNGLLALKDSPHSPISIEQDSMRSILPSLTLDDNTAQQQNQAGAEQTRPLTVQEQRTTTVTRSKETETAEQQHQNTPTPWYQRHWDDTLLSRQLALCAQVQPLLGINLCNKNLGDN